MNVYESRLENTSSASARDESAVLEYSDSESDSIVGVVMLLEQTLERAGLEQTPEWAAVVSGRETLETLECSRAMREEEPVDMSMVVEASDILVRTKEIMTEAPRRRLFIEFRVDFFLVVLSYGQRKSIRGYIRSRPPHFPHYFRCCP